VLADRLVVVTRRSYRPAPVRASSRASLSSRSGKLDGLLRARILRAIAALEDDPRPAGVETLVGEAGLWCIRLGDFCVVYEINDIQLIVLVVRIAHRSEICRSH
jgi:mRNA interferase RelE/StbE